MHAISNFIYHFISCAGLLNNNSVMCFYIKEGSFLLDTISSEYREGGKAQHKNYTKCNVSLCRPGV